jgi:hypothetical protein
MAKHYLVFIHGMGEAKPSPEEDYDKLWNNLATEFDETVNGNFSGEFERVGTNWHTERLFKAETTIFDNAFPELVERKLSPLRALRKFLTFFLGDVVAYVSEDVNFIRRTVWQQMWEKLEIPLKEENATYSIIAHSLGSAIAFDYLFSLFKKNELFVPEPKPNITPEEIGLLQDQFRHLFTFGSPIGLFMMQKGSLWDDEEPFSTIYNPVRSQGRVWRNFYDRDDLIAYPLAQLFSLNQQDNQDCQLEDISVETGFLVFDAHTNYWQNQKLAREIIKVIAPDD